MMIEYGPGVACLCPECYRIINIRKLSKISFLDKLVQPKLSTLSVESIDSSLN